MRSNARTARRWLFLYAAFGAALTGCGGSPGVTPDRPDSTASVRSAPKVTDQSMPVREPDSAVRTVVHGDTLYSIAWETGRDYRELAKWNQIAPPYTIKPGQTLRVKPPAPESAAHPQKQAAVSSGTKKAPTGKPSATRGTRPPTTVASESASGKRAASSAARTVSAAGSAASTVATTAPSTGKKPRTSRASSSTPASIGPGGWSWPADGPILNRYSESDSKGVDIAGTRDAPVRAAANGRVVYQGSGLRGYGQLIIIKHNDEFLSAYAHNDRIHVKEGDAVKRGQKIADMGSTGTDRVKLHFEIRRQGVPVDPLKYLPSR